LANVPATILIAIGSNRRHGRFGSPAAVLTAAVGALGAAGLPVTARSRARSTAPLGPRQRRFANAMVAVASDLPLGDVLTILQSIERAFGRSGGRRWGPRVLDLDIIAAEATVMPTPGWRTARTRLAVPHRGLAGRSFALDPLVEIAPGWRHPVLHLTARQLRARLRGPRRSPETDP